MGFSHSFLNIYENAINFKFLKTIKTRKKKQFLKYKYFNKKIEIIEF